MMMILRNGKCLIIYALSFASIRVCAMQSVDDGDSAGAVKGNKINEVLNKIVSSHRFSSAMVQRAHLLQ